MSEFHSLQLAAEVATRHRDAMSRQHAQCLRAQAYAKEQMQQLQGYGQDSDAAWSLQMGSINGAHLLQFRYQFMDRLQHAIDLQHQVLAEQARQVKAAASRLLQAEFKLAGLQQVLKKRQAAAELRARRRDQRQTDEMAALRHFHHQATQNRSESHGH